MQNILKSGKNEFVTSAICFLMKTDIKRSVSQKVSSENNMKFVWVLFVIAVAAAATEAGAAAAKGGKGGKHKKL